MALNENLPQASSPNAMSGPTRPSQEIERVDKLYDSVLMKVTKMEASLKKSAEYMKDIVRSGSNQQGDSKVNIGGQNGNLFGRVSDVTDATMQKLNQVLPPGQGPSGWDRAKAIGSSAMYYAAAVMPNTLDAVTQRITTQGVASMIGQDPNALIRQSNSMLRGGMTGPYSAQTSTAILASQGIIPTMGSYGNIMNQVGGLSVLTGMSNEQVSAGMGGINGMNFMRIGINARTANGSLKDPASLSNDLYRRMFGGRKITEAQAAQVFNTHSRSYQDIAMAAGGDQNLIATLQNTIYYQAKGGGEKLNLDPKNVKNNILKLPSDDPTRAMYNYQGSEAGKLEATGTGLVGGYSGALNTTAFVNDQFTRLAKILPALTTAFGNLKGFLDTLPTAGNTGAAMYGGLSRGMQSWMDYKGGQFTAKALDKIMGTHFADQQGGMTGQPGMPGNALVPYTGPGGGGPVTPMGAVTQQANHLLNTGMHNAWGKIRGLGGKTSIMKDIKSSGGVGKWAKGLFSAAKDAITGYAEGGVKGALMKAGKDLAPMVGQAVLSGADSAFGYGDQTQTGGWGNQISMAPVAGVAGPYQPGAYSQGSAIQYPENYPGAYHGDPNDPSKVTWVPGMVRDPETGRFVSNMDARNAWLAGQGQQQGGGDGGGDTTIFPPGSFKKLWSKGKSLFSRGGAAAGEEAIAAEGAQVAEKGLLRSVGSKLLTSGGARALGMVGLGIMAKQATDWAVPKLRSFGRNTLGIREGTVPDRLGTVAAKAGGYAAAGALIGSVIPGFGTAIGAVAGAIYGAWMGWRDSAKKPEEKKPKNVKHDRWGQMYDPVTGRSILPTNRTTGEFDSDEFNRTGYRDTSWSESDGSTPDLKRWQQGQYSTPSSSWLNEGKGASGTSLTSVIQSAGFSSDSVDLAYAVAMAESGGHAKSHNTNKKTGDNSYGLFQINMIGDMGPSRRKQFHLKSNNELFDPLTNAKAAYAISSHGKNWNPWSTYKSGKYKDYLGKSGANDPTNVSTFKADQNNETKSDLPRNAREAAQWAIEQVKSNATGWHNYCERFTEMAWGKPGRYASALAGWAAAKKEKRAYEGKTPPPGAMVYWGGGQYGHAAVSIGGGKIVSTDIKRKGQADIVTIDYLTKQWGKPYLGWADPDKGTKLNKSATAIDPGTVSVDTSVVNPQQAANKSGNPWWKDIANSVGNFFGGNSDISSSSSNSSSGSDLSTLMNITGSGFNVSSPSTSTMLGLGSSSPMNGSNSGITINMNVNIASASTGDAQRLARQVKDILQRELRTDSIRNY